jgi:DNA-binding response OmpR family regulator
MIVMVVEDDDDLRGLLEDALSLEFEVLGCANGAEAAGRLQRETVDVLLTDMDLPAVGGEELARIARTRPQRPGVVVMSGSPARLDLGRPWADVALAKPFALVAVRAAIRRADACARRAPSSAPALALTAAR